LEIAVRKVSDVQVIQLHGALRIGQAVDDLRGVIEPAVQSGDNRIVLNLEDVRMIDSSGIGLLVRFLALTKERGGNLKLVRPSKFAIQTLRLICVHHLFEIFEDDDQAVQSFS
jgi:anti-sigma B factor antagonist